MSWERIAERGKFRMSVITPAAMSRACIPGAPEGHFLAVFHAGEAQDTSVWFRDCASLRRFIDDMQPNGVEVYGLSGENIAAIEAALIPPGRLH